MPVYINFLEDVRAIRFSVTYMMSEGKDHPATIEENRLLKANIEAMGLTIKSKLTIEGSTSNSFFSRSYESSDLSYLVRANSFNSIEDIKVGVMRGFSEHIATIPYRLSPKHMEYKFENDSEEKLMAYLSARSKIYDVEENDSVIEGPYDPCRVQ